ncbi:hypothetical protein Golomagni_07194 [Golovinomyces magnicellulatus]|nr:hypothetical protein Golomagni_07194 [Golovinomyces magnicellulatus]
MVNPWESKVLKYGASEDAKRATDTANLIPRWQPLQDSLIYPGLYSGTGFDLMKILFYVFSRPNPQISLGPVDCSVAIVVCDLDKPDSPIVYASESFSLLTGYSAQEAVGKNCRFLQNRPDTTTVAPAVRDKNRRAALQMRQAVKGKDEIQIELINYKKNGQQFRNMLSIIPVHDTVASTHLAIGFLAEY